MLISIYLQTLKMLSEISHWKSKAFSSGLCNI